MSSQTDQSVGEVLAGRSGYLFLADGGHKVMTYATGKAEPKPESFANFHGNISARAAYCSENQILFRHLIVPDKQSVLSEFCPLQITARLGEKYLADSPHGGQVLYPRALLENMPCQTYYRTDTHLTNSASIHLATVIAEEIFGCSLAEGKAWLLAQMTPDSAFVGDLATKLVPPQSEAVQNFHGSWNTVWHHNDFAGNNGIVDLRFTPQAQIASRILIFGDSFGRELAWFLSYFFSEVYFLRTPYFHTEISDQIRPDCIITQNAERYLDHVMPDDGRPSFFMYPLMTEHPYKPPRAFVDAFSAVLSFPREPYLALWKSLASSPAGFPPHRAEQKVHAMTLEQTRDLVTSLYENLLRRSPRPAEFEHWVQFVQNGNPPESLYYAFVNSQEYRLKTQIVSPFPLGHYYSPIVDPAAVSQYAERERRTAATAIAGIEVPLEEMERFWRRSSEVLRLMPYQESKSDRHRFFLDNNVFSYGDAIALRAMMADLRPRTVIEIGSGFSSACMLDSADEFGIATEFTFIDPSSERLRSLLWPEDLRRVRIMESAVQEIELDLFRTLGPGDILFIDSSHVLKTGSDVHYELFHILPALRAGVIIHFHDIQFPFEYPDSWIQESYSWNEIYAVRAFLMYNSAFRMRFWGSCFAALRSEIVAQTAPLFIKNSGGSLWIEKVVPQS